MLNESDVQTIRLLVEEQGEHRAAQQLGVTVPSLLRVLAGRQNLRPGTIALLQRGLVQLKNGGAK